MYVDFILVIQTYLYMVKDCMLLDQSYAHSMSRAVGRSPFQLEICLRIVTFIYILIISIWNNQTKFDRICFFSFRDQRSLIVKHFDSWFQCKWERHTDLRLSAKNMMDQSNTPRDSYQQVLKIDRDKGYLAGKTK